MKKIFLGMFALCIGLSSVSAFAMKDICCGKCTFHSDGTFECSDCHDC